MEKGKFLRLTVASYRNFFYAGAIFLFFFQLLNREYLEASMKRMASIFLAGLFVFVFPSFSFAESASFPIKEIAVQVFNFSIFVVALIFLVRKPVKLFFHKRQEEFFSFEEQAVQLEREKKKELEAWEQKLESLKEQEKGIQKKAQSEGKKLVFQKREEIKNLQNRLKTEAEFFLQLEREKSKKELLEKWKYKIAQKAGKELEGQTQSPSFQQELVRDFFKQMESRLLS